MLRSGRWRDAAKWRSTPFLESSFLKLGLIDSSVQISEASCHETTSLHRKFTDTTAFRHLSRLTILRTKFPANYTPRWLIIPTESIFFARAPFHTLSRNFFTSQLTILCHRARTSTASSMFLSFLSPSRSVKVISAAFEAFKPGLCPQSCRYREESFSLELIFTKLRRLLQKGCNPSSGLNQCKYLILTGIHYQRNLKNNTTTRVQ